MQQRPAIQRIVVNLLAGTSLLLCALFMTFWTRGMLGCRDFIVWSPWPTTIAWVQAEPGRIHFFGPDEPGRSNGFEWRSWSPGREPVPLRVAFPSQLSVTRPVGVWDVAVPWWWLVLLTGVLPAWRSWRWWSRHKRDRSRHVGRIAKGAACATLLSVCIANVISTGDVFNTQAPASSSAAAFGWPFGAVAYEAVDTGATWTQIGWGSVLGNVLAAVLLAGAAGLLVQMPLLVTRALKARSRRARGLCRTCGYNLTANTSGVCPECGSRIDATTGIGKPGDTPQSINAG